MTKIPAPTARDRLLTAADELFYAEGIHTVGIDRIIEKAGVAKASLYNTFGSKDELVRAYLGSRHDRQRARIDRHLTGVTDPRDKILAVFEAQAELVAEPTYRGCAFANAAAESQPDSVAFACTQEYRGWLRDLLTGFAAEAGAADPDLLGRQLQHQYDGVSLAARMGDQTAVGTCRATVTALLVAALPKRRRRSTRS